LVVQPTTLSTPTLTAIETSNMADHIYIVALLKPKEGKTDEVSDPSARMIPSLT